MLERSALRRKQKEIEGLNLSNDHKTRKEIESLTNRVESYRKVREK